MSKFTMNRDTYEAFYNGQSVHLLPKEWDVMKILIDWKGKVISRDQIISLVYGEFRPSPGSRMIDQHVSRIRRKTALNLIKTVSCRGYRFTGTITR